MATLPIKPLDGADGYLRWKESVLLRLHSVGVAHVLTDEPPPAAAPGPAAGGGGGAVGAAAAKKWARDDAVCRGHILYALSDRIFPDYVRHGTGRAVWHAVARTYDLEASPFARYSRQYERFLRCFRFEEEEEEEEKGASSSASAPPSFLEQLAHAEAMVATCERPLSDYEMASTICDKLPAEMAAVIRCGEMGMALIWKSALIREKYRMVREDQNERRLGGGGGGSEAEQGAASVPQDIGRKAGHRHHRRR